MEEIVALIFQFIIEVGVQIFGGAAIDAAESRRRKVKDEAGCGWIIVYAAFGAILGGLSLLVAPTLMLPNMGLRVANLVASPLLAGLMSYLAAKHIFSDGRDPDQHFWRGCLFAFAFGVVRFAFAGR
jgi:hypothetical protein